MSDFRDKLKRIEQPSGTGGFRDKLKPLSEAEPAQQFVQTSPTFGQAFKQDIVTPAVGVFDALAAPGRTVMKGVAGGVNSIFGTDVQAPTNETSKQMFQDSLGIDLSSTQGKIGRFVGEVGTFAAPGGLAAKATTKLPFLLRAGAQGVTAASQQALNTGELDKDSLVAGAAGAGTPIGIGTAKLAGRFVKSVIKNTAAGISGKGTKVIDAVLSNPRAAREGLEEVVSRADDAAAVRKGVSNLAKEASKEFGEALDELPKRLGREPKVLTAGKSTTIKVGGKTYTLSLKGVKSQLTESLRKFDVNVKPSKADRFDFSEAPLDKAEETRLREVFDVINEWKDTTPVGFHRLSRKISNFRRPGEQSRELNAIIDNVSRNIHNYISKRIPAAKEMLQKYRAAQDTIDVFDKEFATNGKFIGGTVDRIGTEKKLGSLFSGEKTTGTKFLESKLPGGKDIPSREAGRLLSEDITRSGASIGDMLRTAVNTVISPRLIGDLTIRTGIAAERLTPFIQKLQAADPVVRGAMITTFLDLVGEDSTQESIKNE